MAPLPVRCAHLIGCPVLVTLPLALLAVRIQSPLGGEFQFRLSRHLIVIRPACVSKNDKRNMHMTLGNVCRRHVRLGRLMVEAAFPELNSQGMKSLISVRMRTRTSMPTPPMPTTNKTAGESNQPRQEGRRKRPPRKPRLPTPQFAG